MTREEARALVERQARAWEAMDGDAIVADFAPDGTLVSPGGAWKGPEEIRPAAESFFSAADGVRVEVGRVLLDGEAGAVQWTWRERRDGRWYAAEDAVIFVLRDGKIAYWREYFDPSDLEGP